MPIPGDAESWGRPNLATPKAVNTLTFLPRAPSGSYHMLTLVNAQGRVGTISIGGSSFTYLGVSHPPSGVIIFTISFLNLISFSILLCAIYVTCLCSCLCHFLLVIFIHPLLPLFLNSAPCIIITSFLCFSLCHYEVNIHTYLTTWLSLCPVGIFLGFSP